MVLVLKAAPASVSVKKTAAGCDLICAACYKHD